MGVFSPLPPSRAIGLGLLVPAGQVWGGSPLSRHTAGEGSGVGAHRGLLITKYAGTNLHLELDTVPLWRGDVVSVKQLAGDFAQYHYRPVCGTPRCCWPRWRMALSALTWQ